MYTNYRTLAAIATASLLAACAAQANKGADYHHAEKKADKYRYSVTAGVNYLQPRLDNLDYFDVVTISTTSESTKIHNLDEEYSFGYYVGFGYLIGKKYDLQLSWELNNNNSSASESASGPGVYYRTSNNSESFTLTSGETATAETKQNLEYQVADGTLGQYHKLSKTLVARIFTGLRYAQIKSDTDTTYTDPNFNGGSGFTDDFDSKFWGVGPELGVDAEYTIHKNFGLVGHMAGTILVGDLTTSSNVFSTDNDHPQFVESNTQARMVPGIDARIGLTVNVPIMEHKDRFVIEAGYEVAYYFSAVDQITTQSSFSDEEGTNHHYSDVGIQGPYLNFSVLF